MQDAKWYMWNSFEEQTRPVSHGDLIRVKSDEELAEWLWPIGCPRNSAHNMCAGEGDDCKKCWLEWLKQEADNAKLD